MKNFKYSGLLLASLLLLIGIAANAMGLTSEVIQQGMLLSAGAMILPVDRVSANYEKFRSLLASPQINKPNAIITRTDLRLEMIANVNQNTYSFNPEASTGSGDRPLENKLEKGEIFMITDIALGIQRQKAGTDGEDQAINPIFHTPDPSYFTTAGEADALRNLYQGLLKFTTAGSERSSEILTHHLEYRPDQPYQVTAATGNPANELPGYGPMLNDRGYFPLVPNLSLDGDASNKIELTLGNGVRAAIGGAPATDNVIILLLHGFLYSGDDATGRFIQCG